MACLRCVLLLSLLVFVTDPLPPFSSGRSSTPFVIPSPPTSHTHPDHLCPSLQVIWIPACSVMFWLERRAMKDNLINIELARTGVDDTAVDDEKAVVEPYRKQSFGTKTAQVFHEADMVGLILLGFGWSLVRPSSSVSSLLTRFRIVLFLTS